MRLGTVQNDVITVYFREWLCMEKCKLIGRY